MNEKTIQTTPASRREGTVMGIKKNRKRLAGAAIALTGLAGGAVAAQAATFSAVVAPGALPPATFPSIAPTCTANCTISLDAGTGSVTVQDAINGPQSIPFEGFGVNGAPPSLAGSLNSTIKVPQGTTLTINLSQTAGGDPIDLSFPSLPASDVSHSGSVYTVVASKIGTSVFQPGRNPGAPKQVAMGLVGVLIVTPKATTCTSATLSCAYDATSYADEVLVATTDLDYEFATNDPTFAANGMGYFGQPVNPDGSTRKVYHLVNGKAFPDTDVIDVRVGDSVLVRSVNAGVTDRSMSSLGLRQTLLARNSSAYQDPQTLIAPLVGPGETADIAVQIPANAQANQRYSLIDAGRQMNHETGYGFGGALTFFNVWGASPTVDTLAAASITTAVGNPLIDRTYATDYPTPIGTLSPVFVALPGAPLPAGTLQDFSSWNQAAAGGSPTPSAGGLLHAYVMRPTGTPDQYQVVFDSGLLTVPALTTAGVSQMATFPTAGVAVQAGDVLAFYGQGVPVDITVTGTDVLSYPAPTPPVAGETITLGVDPGFPIYPQSRTYSFGATVIPAPESATLTATGHASPGTQNITGYQTVVNAGATPAEGDWSATTSVTPGATVTFTTAPLAALPGQTIWVRVQQDATTWSPAASIVVPAP